MSFNVDNDDDLFEYDPEKEVNEEKTFSNHSSEDYLSNSSFSDEEKKLLKNITNSTDLDEYPVDNLKAALSTNFANTNYHMMHGGLDLFANTVAIVEVLDELTEGKFTMKRNYYLLESKIIRSLFILHLANIIFRDNGDLDPEVESLFKSVTNIDFTQMNVKTCYLSTINIMRHTVNINRAAYVKLSNELGLERKDSLLDEEMSFETFYSEVSADYYLAKGNSNLFAYLMNNGLKEDLESFFDQEITF